MAKVTQSFSVFHTLWYSIVRRAITPRWLHTLPHPPPTLLHACVPSARNSADRLCFVCFGRFYSTSTQNKSHSAKKYINTLESVNKIKNRSCHTCWYEYELLIIIATKLSTFRTKTKRNILHVSQEVGNYTWYSQTSVIQPVKKQEWKWPIKTDDSLVQVNLLLQWILGFKKVWPFNMGGCLKEVITNTGLILDVEMFYLVNFIASSVTNQINLLS